MNIFHPKFAYLLFKKNLLTSKNISVQWPKKIEKKVIDTEFGQVKTYKYGKGKCIWLVHGSSNAYQLMPLMKNLDKYGYSCIAIEYHPNDNENMSLTKWIKAFDFATQKIIPPSHVVTHGLGASVLGNSRWFSNYSHDLTVISRYLIIKIVLTLM